MPVVTSSVAATARSLTRARVAARCSVRRGARASSYSGRARRPRLHHPLPDRGGVQPLADRELPPGGEALPAQQLDARVVLRVAARRGLERIPDVHLEPGRLHLADDPHQARAGPRLVDRGAVALQLIRGQVVVAGADEQPRGRDLHVVVRAALALPHRAERGLVRRLVLREAHVAVGAEDVERSPLLVEGHEELAHRAPHRRLELVAVGGPVAARVVPLETLVEREALGWEASEGHARGPYR